MRISDWSSDVCSSDLRCVRDLVRRASSRSRVSGSTMKRRSMCAKGVLGLNDRRRDRGNRKRSEEHTSELQSLMRISYAVFCLKKKKPNINNIHIKHE